MLLTLPLLVTAAAAATPPDFDAFFEDFAKKRDAIEVIEARFVQRSIVPGEILVSDGTLLYARPRRIVFRTGDPERVTLIDGRRGFEYEPEIRQLAIYALDDQPAADVFFMGFDSDLGAMREAYEVNLFTTDDPERGSRGIQIKPLPESEDAAYFNQVNLYLRDDDYLPYRIHIVNDAESQTILEFTHYVVNGGPAPEDSQIFVPEGVTIVEDGEVIERTGPEGARLPEPIEFTPGEGREIVIPEPGVDQQKRSAAFELTDIDLIELPPPDLDRDSRAP